MNDYSDITRIEVISSNGREFVRYNISIKDILIQNNKRTLKIIIDKEYKKGEIKDE